MKFNSQAADKTAVLLFCELFAIYCIHACFCFTKVS